MAGTIDSFFPMGTNVLSNANNFHCPAIQYGCRAKPLYCYPEEYTLETSFYKAS